MFPALNRSYDALQVFVEARDTAMANPGDSAREFMRTATFSRAN
jgi:hypothetical protein